MRVTVLSSLPPQKGVSPYTMALLGALAARADIRASALGFRSLYPRFAYPGGAPESGRAEPVPVPVRRTLAWYNPISWLWAGLRLRGEILHVQWWSWILAPPCIGVICLAKLRGMRVVVTVHNVRPHERARWKRLLNHAVVRLADELIVHSQSNKLALAERGIDGAWISVIPHGLLEAVDADARPSPDEARHALGIPLGERVALLFGNLRPYKGAGTLLAATAIAKDLVPGLRVVIAGELWRGCPDPRGAVERLGLNEQVTCRLGYASAREAAQLLAATDVVVLPYERFDAQSGVGALALAAGRALIVSDTGGLPGLVADGRAIVPVGDAKALAEAMVRVLNDEGLRRKLESDSRAIAEGLSWERIAAQTVGVYVRALGLESAATKTSEREAA